MNKRVIMVSFSAVWVLGLATYAFYRNAAAIIQERSISRPTESLEALQAPPAQQSDPRPIPPPPPHATNEPLSLPRPDSSRTLIGTTSEQLKRIEQHLPEGAQVYTSVIGRTHLKAALVKADLDGDRIPEIIVVHKGHRPTVGEPNPPLGLSVLSSEGDRQIVSLDIPLLGGVLFNIEVDGSDVPLAVRDLTGDGRPAIIVASGGGASVGGSLQVFETDGKSFRRLTADIYGHFFSVTSRGRGNPSIIRARGKDEDETTIYEWNGRRFEQAGKHVVELR